MQPYIQGIQNFCKNLYQDTRTIADQDEPNEKLVQSVGLRALGALGGTYGLYRMLVGLTGGGVAPLVFGAVCFAVGHDCIQFGKNVKPAQGVLAAAQRVAQQGKHIFSSLWNSFNLPSKADLNGTWLFGPIYDAFQANASH
ncbi:MAG: hypothetical protein WB791_04000 [Waddliaceae bacterium]